MKNRTYRNTVLLVALLIGFVMVAKLPFANTTIVKAAASFLTTVTHDATLTGDGTSTLPLGVANNGIGTTQLTNNSVTGAKIAFGQVVKSVNGLTDNVILGAGSNISITQSGNTLTIASMLGLTSVSHDNTLSGNGTDALPLGIPNNGIGTPQLADGAVTASKIAPGQAVTSINNLADNVTLAAGSNISITSSGNTLTLASNPSPSSQYINPLRIATLQWYEANQTGLNFPVGHNSRDLAFDGANIWVTSNTGIITKLRATDGATLGTFSLGQGPRGIAFDGANLWITNQSGNSVTKLRASDFTILGTFPVGQFPERVAFDGADVWVTNLLGNTVTKLRASDGLTLGTFAVGQAPKALAFDGSNIWVVNETGGSVTKLRASDGVTLGTFAVGDATGVAFDGANIWVTNFVSNTVTKLRASDGVSLGIFGTGQGPRDVAFDGANIWVVNLNSNSVTKLRASDGGAVGTFAVGQAPQSIAFDGANIWVVNFTGDTVSKL